MKNLLQRLFAKPNVNYEDWQQHVIRSLNENGLQSPLGDPMPGFPAEELQRNTTGLDGESGIRQAFHFYRDIQRALAQTGASLRENSRVLDFGVGWGRIARLFLRDVRLGSLYGIDVDPAFIEITARSFGAGNFSVCAPFPPTKFDSGSFDLVSAYSVFSHLSEDAFNAWLAEFARILKPGGHLAFTTRHVSFFDYCAWAAAQKDLPQGYTRALGELFVDIDAARAKYRDGSIVHATSVGVSGGGPRTQAFYGETFIPKAYVERACRDKFTLVLESFDDARYDQTCFVLRRLPPANE
jgi:SAM-dependent methyltransferase